ncbi:MAG: folylpolyglutamate synthase/dihydrofolate synthase family protein [archaeon]
MNLAETKAYLEGLEQFGSHLGLGRIRQICAELGSPQLKCKTVIVGGTNGKGSVSMMLSSILLESGLKVGTYTSPPLSDDRERILVDKTKIPGRDLARLISRIRPLQEKYGATHFEVLTAAAFLYFLEKNVDYAVIEVGLGGRYDATNVAEPELSIITNVDLDHTKVLGSTVLEIAKEKAGIIRQGKVLVTGSDKQEVVQYLSNVCKVKNCRLIRASSRGIAPISSDFKRQAFRINGYSLETKMLGGFQRKNAAVAVSAAEVLGIKQEHIVRGISNSFWPGRFEVMQTRPIVILSADHNPAGVDALCSTLDSIRKRKIFVFGASKDKDIRAMLGRISKSASKIILTKYSKPRSADPEKMVSYASGNFAIRTPLSKAVDSALKEADSDSIVVITGSIFLAGEARQRWRKVVSFETPK